MLSYNCASYFPDGGHYSAGCPACDPLSPAYKGRGSTGSGATRSQYTAADAVRDLPCTLRFARASAYCDNLRRDLGVIARNLVGARFPFDAVLAADLERLDSLPDSELPGIGDRVLASAPQRSE